MKSTRRKEIAQANGLVPEVVTQGSEQKAPGSPPDPEVLPRPRRRQFTVEYKLRILKEADDSQLQGDIGALLRREGLYSSNLTEWRRQREEGLFTALSPKRRGPAPAPAQPVALEFEQLKREHELLQHRFRQAELIIEVQKKVSELLGIPLQMPRAERSNS
jgi:transposase-like protein